MKVLLLLLYAFSAFVTSSSTVHADGFVQGTLMDRTRSVKGQEFFSKFSMQWNQVPQAKNVNVVVSEVYSPRRGISITIHVEENQVFQVPIAPRKPIDEAIVNAAKNAAARAARSPRQPVIF